MYQQAESSWEASDDQIWRREDVTLLGIRSAEFTRVVGDHTLFIGAVEEFRSTEDAPLIFHRGGCFGLGVEPA